MVMVLGIDSTNVFINYVYQLVMFLKTNVFINGDGVGYWFN